MKKGLGIILGLIMAISLVACGNGNKDNIANSDKQQKIHKAEQKPEDAITDFFTKLKNCNFVSMKQSVLTDNSIDLDSVEYYSNNYKKALNYWLQKLSYEVVNVNIEGDTAIANVKVSTLNGKQIYEMVDEHLAKKYSDEEKENFLINTFKDKSNEIVSKNVDIKLEKKDGKWLIKLDNNLLTAICGGINPKEIKNK